MPRQQYTGLIDRLLRSFPAGHYGLTAMLRLVRIEETTRVETACIECTRRPRLLINPDFVERHANTTDKRPRDEVVHQEFCLFMFLDVCITEIGRVNGVPIYIAELVQSISELGVSRSSIGKTEGPPSSLSIRPFNCLLKIQFKMDN